jgi:AraC-like DNA-binding protein
VNHTFPHALLSDPGRINILMRFRDLAAKGIHTLHQWTPREGLTFASPRPALQHAYPLMIACLTGSLTVSGKSDVELHADDVLIIEPGCWHDQNLCRPGTTAVAIGFLAGRTKVSFSDHAETLIGAVAEGPYHSLFSSLISTATASDRLCIVDDILAGIARERIEYLDWHHHGIVVMADWMRNNLHLPISVNEIFAQGTVGRTTGFNHFKKFFGRTPKQELLAQRLSIARHLLLREFKPNEAARRSGFLNSTTMNRSLRNHPQSPMAFVQPHEQSYEAHGVS